jgi:CxxC-x17-CxxC domain-containing protein
MITFFGKTNFRGENKKFGIKEDDRRKHMYIIGKTGMGKTELLKNMAIQDILNGHGLGFIDPHGDAAEELLDFIPKERIKDVVYINPGDIDHPIAFNIMENVAKDQKHLVAGGLMGVFKKIWPDVWSSRMEYILNNAILALLEIEGSTLLGVNRLLSDPEWREQIVSQLKDPVVKAFWTQEFAKYSQRYEVEATAAIQNKIGQFISSALIRNIIGQPKSTIDVREIMDSQKILIVNLSKGKVGEDPSKLLGALLITKIQLAAMSRVDIEEQNRNDFFLYVDEFQNFATESFATILSEARKYRLSLILAHQYIAQMDDSVRDAVFGNIGTMLNFRVGAEDAQFLEREFAPEFDSNDLVNLSKQHIYVKLMIDGLTSRPFSAITLPPREIPERIYVDEIINSSRKTYAKSKEEVENQIAQNMGSGESKTNDTQRAELYDAVCSTCGKNIKVPFKPEKGKDVYCKSCLKKKEDPESKFVSLMDSFKSFKPENKDDKEKKEKEQKQKRTVKTDELRDLLKEATQTQEQEKKEIKPGEYINFEE